MTDVDPRNGSGPLNSDFVTCATHGRLEQGRNVTLTCENKHEVRGRYLFVAANVNKNFLLREVEVFNG